MAEAQTWDSESEAACGISECSTCTGSDLENASILWSRCSEVKAQQDRTRTVCEAEVEKHLDEWLLNADGLPTYENWLAELHPENLRKRATAGPVIDGRMYLEGCFQRQLWNRRMQICFLDSLTECELAALTKCERRRCHVLPREPEESAMKHTVSVPLRAIKTLSIESLYSQGCTSTSRRLSMRASVVGKLSSVHASLGVKRMKMQLPNVGSNISAAFHWLGRRSEGHATVPQNPELVCHHCNTRQEFTAGDPFVLCFACHTLIQTS